MWLDHVCKHIAAYEKDTDTAENKIKVFLYRLYKNDPTFNDDDFKDECLRELVEQLEKEGRFGNTVRKLFGEVKADYKNNQGDRSFKEGLKRILFEIEPFNIALFRELAKETENQLERVRDKVILLLLGPTGSGKSTTIQYLCGSKLVKTKVKIKDGVYLPHIGVD
jgi:signal recognition particle GTPase